LGMTPRERWLAVVGRKPFDRIPMDYCGTGEMTAKLKAGLNCADEDALWLRLGVDRPHWVSAEYDDPRPEGKRDSDIWGVKTRRVAYAGGTGAYDEVVDPPLAPLETVEELAKYPWPDPARWDASTVAERCKGLDKWAIQGGYFSVFYLYSNMRGVELSMEDLIASPEFAHAALERIFEIHYSFFEKTLKAAGGRIDFVEVTEDLGTQEAPLFSMATFREFIRPRMKQMMDLAHRYGARVMTHSDGAIRAFIPDLIEMGTDILNPIQWRCAGMEREGLKRDFGKDLVFHGGVDNQQTLPFGTVEDVRAEVRDNIRILGAGGGYILAPCHNVQVITPVENVVAMYEEGLKGK
jgi:uroporphyrinogen decarboxylase